MNDNWKTMDLIFVIVDEKTGEPIASTDNERLLNYREANKKANKLDKFVSVGVRVVAAGFTVKYIHKLWKSFH